MHDVLSIELRGRTGEVIGGRYELLDILGSGGQSVVYRARDRVDGDMVALKILGWSDPDACERMFREAHVMCQLQGTSAVRVLHQGTTHDGAMVLVMEYLDGEDLSAFLERSQTHGFRASRVFVERVFTPIVRTLEAAHQLGIVHRDVKAENVFLVREAQGPGVRLLDFGFAKLLRAPTITADEVVAGSPSYFPPEVWTAGSSRADTRADVYALGVMLFRCLGGQMPFTGGPVELMQASINDERPSLLALRPDLSPDIDGWVRQALAKQPEDRFQNVNALWRALLACL